MAKVARVIRTALPVVVPENQGLSVAPPPRPSPVSQG
jgi:hypothetical protein